MARNTKPATLESRLRFRVHRAAERCRVLTWAGPPGWLLFRQTRSLENRLSYVSGEALAATSGRRVAALTFLADAMAQRLLWSGFKRSTLPPFWSPYAARIHRVTSLWGQLRHLDGLDSGPSSSITLGPVTLLHRDTWRPPVHHWPARWPPAPPQLYALRIGHAARFDDYLERRQG